MTHRRRNLAFVLPGVVLLALLAVPELEVLAWSHTGASWSGSSATYYVNPNFPDPGAGTAADQVEAVRTGADEWRLSGQGGFAFVYGGTTAMTSVSPDGQNTVFYSPTDGGGALAVCWYWFVGSDLQDFDIEFYDRDGGYDYVWSINPGAFEFDIEGVATHEFGHALGMGHSSVSGATMYPSVSPGNTAVRTLAQDDIDGYQALYGYSGPATPVVSQVTPSAGWIDGGYPVTIDGSLFPSSGTSVTFDGVTATNVVRASSTRLTCTAPGGQEPGGADVTVSVQGVQDTLQNGFDYLTIRYTGGPPGLGQWHPMEVRVPAAPNTVFQGLLSFGNAGISLSQVGDPQDTRVVPLTWDWLLEYSVLYSGLNISQDIVGITDATGTHTWKFHVPDLQDLQGMTFWVGYVLGDTGGSPSGISYIGNAVPVTMP